MSRVWIHALCVTGIVMIPAPAAARAAGSVYVVDAGVGADQPAGVAPYTIGASGQLTPDAAVLIAGGSRPLAEAVSPDGRSLYVADQVGLGAGTISQFSVDPATGALTPKSPATMPTPPSPDGVAVSPDGRSVYVIAGTGPGTVSEYSIDPSTGDLVAKTPAAIDAGVAPTSVVVTPNGETAYVVDHGGSSVSQYAIDPVTGALSAETPASVATGGSPFSIAVTPNGRSAYVSNGFDEDVSQFDIDPTTGALTPKTPATVGGVNLPTSIAVTPDGLSAYVSGVRDGVVAQYSIDPATGNLVLQSPAAVDVPGAEQIAVTPDGRYAYVLSFGSTSAVDEFAIGAGDVLSALAPPSVPAGGSPEAIAVDPRPAAAPAAPDPTETRVRCARDTAPVRCIVRVIDTSPQPSTPSGSVLVKAQGRGRVLARRCVLTGSGAVARCHVRFAIARHGQTVTAAYGGDATHQASSATTSLRGAIRHRRW